MDYDGLSTMMAMSVQICQCQIPGPKEALVLDVHYPDGSTIEWTHNIHRF